MQGRLPIEELRDGQYEVVQCEKCGFIWQPNILSDDYMAKLYEEWILPEESRTSFTHSSLHRRQQFARQVWRLASHFPERKPHEISILDFGMGWGEWVLMAKAHGFDVCGLEISSSRLKHAQENNIPTITKLETGYTFDIIFANQVLEHVPNPFEVFQQIASHLKPGGIACISVPNGDAITREIHNPDWQPGRKAIAVQPLEHINCFTYKTLMALGRRVGLTLTQKSQWRYQLANLLPIPTANIPKLKGLTLYFTKGTFLLDE
ncbi:MAG: class I SAM-dependent methyltransferase [Anaerolineae bacterium]|nr:class I SAM-dependent methyltransferase [Anaerolineae bacterium]